MKQVEQQFSKWERSRLRNNMRTSLAAWHYIMISFWQTMVQDHATRVEANRQNPDPKEFAEIQKETAKINLFTTFYQTTAPERQHEIFCFGNKTLEGCADQCLNEGVSCGHINSECWVRQRGDGAVKHEAIAE